MEGRQYVCATVLSVDPQSHPLVVGASVGVVAELSSSLDDLVAVPGTPLRIVVLASVAPRSSRVIGAETLLKLCRRILDALSAVVPKPRRSLPGALQLLGGRWRLRTELVSYRREDLLAAAGRPVDILGDAQGP